MSATAIVDYITECGTTWSATVGLQGVDLHDWDALLQAIGIDTPAQLFEIGTIAGGIEATADDDLVLDLSAAMTRNVVPGQYAYGLSIQHKTSGEVRPLTLGRWTFYPARTTRDPGSTP